MERETRLEAIMPDTTSLCEQIAFKLDEVKDLLDRVEEEQQQHQGKEEGMAEDIEMRIESDVFVLQQVFSVSCRGGRGFIVNKSFAKVESCLLPFVSYSLAQ